MAFDEAARDSLFKTEPDLDWPQNLGLFGEPARGCANERALGAKGLSSEDGYPARLTSPV